MGEIKQEYKNIKQQWHWQQDHWNHKAYVQHSNRTGYLVVSPSQSASRCVSFSLFAAVVVVAAAAVAAAAAASFVVPLEILQHYPVLAYVALSFHGNAYICQKTREHQDYCPLDVMPCSLVDQYKHFTEPCCLVFGGRAEVYTSLPHHIQVEVYLHHPHRSRDFSLPFFIFLNSYPVSNSASNKTCSKKSPTANDRKQIHHIGGTISIS